MNRLREISIVVPLRNKIHRAGFAIASLLRQTLRPKEIIVVNDASQDSSEDVFKTYRHGIDMYLRLRDHRGAAGARNLGFALSHGEGVFFCDADVVLEPNCLESLASAMTWSRKAYAYCSFNRAGALQGKVVSGPFDYDRLKEGNYISTMSLIRAEILPLPPFDETLERLQDWDLWLSLAEMQHYGVFVPHALFTAFYDAEDISLRGRESYERAERQVLSKHGLM